MAAFIHSVVVIPQCNEFASALELASRGKAVGGTDGGSGRFSSELALAQEAGHSSSVNLQEAMRHSRSRAPVRLRAMMGRPQTTTI